MLTLSAGIAAAGLSIGGCAATADPNLAGPEYPAAAMQTRQLDVQVFREDTTVRFTNTSAIPLGPGRLWLNQWYSRDLPEIAVGETVDYSLSEFRDRYGESFRGGGFWASDKPELLAKAQVETAADLVGLIVVAVPEE